MRPGSAREEAGRVERPRLSVTEQQQLATALLDCECIRDRRIRDQVLQTLRQDAIGQQVSLSRQENDRADVIAMLAAFARHTGGLHALLSCIELFEPGSEASGQVRRLVERMEPDPPLSVDQTAALELLLATIVCPEAEELYWEAVGEFGPAPTVPGHDLTTWPGT